MNLDGDSVAAHSHPEGGRVAFIERAGRLLSFCIGAVAPTVRPGDSTAAVAARVRASLEHAGLSCVLSAMTNERGDPFGHAAAVCVNEVLVHGLPGERVLRAGDVVTIDAAAGVRGSEGRWWHADAARSLVVVGAESAKGDRGGRLLEASEAVHRACLQAARPGVAWGDCVLAATRAAAASGVSIATDYCGHGIGAAVHQSPRLSFRALDESRALVLRPGMIFTIEPVVVEGTIKPRGQTSPDGWSEIEASGRWGAYREETVLVTERGVRVLTATERGREALMEP